MGQVLDLLGIALDDGIDSGRRTLWRLDRCAGRARRGIRVEIEVKFDGLGRMDAGLLDWNVVVIDQLCFIRSSDISRCTTSVSPLRD